MARVPKMPFKTSAYGIAAYLVKESRERIESHQACTCRGAERTCGSDLPMAPALSGAALRQTTGVPSEVSPSGRQPRELLESFALLKVDASQMLSEAAKYSSISVDPRDLDERQAA